MNVSTHFIQRPIATSLLMAAVFLIGAVAFPFLPVAPLPKVDFPTLMVNASLPGASPEIMASSVAQPLEYQFAQIPGLVQMTSASYLGQTSVTLQFDLNQDIQTAAQDTQTAINAAGGQLPKNLPAPPTYRKINPADAPILALGISSKVLPLTKVDEYTENIIAQQISQISGIGQVNVAGQQKPAVRIQVDPAKIAALGIQLEDVANVITSATVNTPKGTTNGDRQSFAIYDNDQLLDAAPWNDVIVAYVNGAPVRVRDIGVAVDGPENTQIAAWENPAPGEKTDQPDIQLYVFKQPGANVIETVKAVKDKLPQILKGVPPSIRVSIIQDRTITIAASVSDVEKTLLVTITLVVGVIFVFLRNIWATIIPGVTVPLALLGTSALMYAVGFSLDNLSLMALTIAVGFVVDDAIVMLENIYRHVEEGLSPMQAAIKGSGEVAFTIVSISLSLIAVFTPLLLMGGVIGRLFREFAVTVTMMIGVSTFVALTLSPMMCSKFLRNEKHVTHGRFYMTVERWFDYVLKRYEQGLDFVFRHQRQTLMVFFATMAATVVLYIVIPKGFFPQQDTGIVQGVTDAPQDVSFEEMMRLTHQITDVINTDPDVHAWGGQLGGQRPLNNGQVNIGLLPRGDRNVSADDIINRLRPKLAKIPGVTLYLQSRQDLNVGGRPGRTQYQYTLQDTDINELNEWAPKLLAKLEALPELRDVASDQQTNSTILSLTIDRDQAARFGLQPSVIDNTLYDAFGQRQVTQYFTQLNSYHVILEVSPEMQRDPKTLDKIYVKSALTGQQVPLSTFVHYDTQHAGYLSINHQAQFPAVTLSFNLAPGAALGTAVDDIDKVSEDMGLPSGVTGTFQGSAQAFQSSLKSQPYLILAALIAVYIILGMLYESYIHPLTILSTLPSAGVGALLILIVCRFDLSIIALIGIILLIGIVKKNGIMMVDFAIQAERDQGLSPEESIRKACLLRFRPIMMTTMAALLGALPLMLGVGTGAELRQPLGFTMAGGLIVSQALTLFTTPVVYLYLDRFSHRMRSRRAAKRAAASEVAGTHAPTV